MSDWQTVLVLFDRHGSLAYAGEGVTQWQHAWQAGRQARRAGATPALQLAAWLHDVGHLFDGEVDTPTLRGHDDRHEARAAAYLQPLFGDGVARPVALHVEAKRYLVTTHAGYAQRLSADSRRSLALQGGPMSEAEARAWLQQPHAADALRLRTWDDLAKETDAWPVNAAQARDELVGLLRHCAAAV